MELHEIGWDDFFAARLPTEPAGVPARVIAEVRDRYLVLTAEGERGARLSGRLRRGAAGRAGIPAVGDWVILGASAGEAEGRIRAVLPRRSTFSRHAPGEHHEEQVVAANVDVAWIVSALDEVAAPARLERYLSLAWESGARPVVVLTKRDLSVDAEESVAAAESVAFGVPVHAVSGATGQGVSALAPYLRPAGTIALLGPAGAGKSTLIGRLLGEERKGGHGAHRQLLRLPGGALVVDTPGMRDLQLWEPSPPAAVTEADLPPVRHPTRRRRRR